MQRSERSRGAITRPCWLSCSLAVVAGSEQRSWRAKRLKQYAQQRYEHPWLLAAQQGECIQLQHSRTLPQRRNLQ